MEKLTIDDFKAAIMSVHQCQLAMIAPDRDADGATDRARAWFGAWAKLLDMSSQEGFPIPPNIAKGLGEQCEFLARGILPAPIRNCISGGGDRVGPGEEADIKCGVAYVLAAKSGIIEDRHPVKSVKEAFGCKDRKAVQAWVTRYGAEIDKSADGDTIARRMTEAGKRYSYWGRGQKAIERRAKVRT